MLGTVSIGFWSCVKQYQKDMPVATNNPEASVEDRWRIYTACWDKWGRASEGCSWGLCRFEDCWGWQDPCCGESARTGTIAFDDAANMYMMTIQLSNTSSLEATAAASQLPLYIDEDIIDEDPVDETWNSLKIEAGAYPFNPGIGNYGGYKIPVIFN